MIYLEGGGCVEFSEKYKPKTIHDGLIENGEIVGYCHLYKHPGYLLSKHIKSHDCLRKECPWLEKNLDSEYFKLRQLVKEKKQLADRLMNLWLNHYISQRTYDIWRNKLKNVNTPEDLQEFKDNKIPVEITISDLMIGSVTFDTTTDRK